MNWAAVCAIMAAEGIVARVRGGGGGLQEDRNDRL